MPVNLGRIVFWSVLASTPFAILLFRGRTWGGGPLGNVRRVAVDYRWHIALFASVIAGKNWIDSLNDPVRGVFGDFTWLMPRIEGHAVLWIQETFKHPTLTAFLAVHYLWMFVFLNYFTILLFAYRDDRALAGMNVLCYLLVYLLAIPFYIFFNVQVTSDAIPGMEALLYHGAPSFYEFFIRVDPLDNAFPSLHIAVPWSFILVTYWQMRRRGYTLRDWEHRGYLLFMIVNFLVFVFSILYLGIHWITDIPGGLLLGLLGATLAEEFEKDLFSVFRGLEARAKAVLAPLGRRARPWADRLRENLRDRLR